MTPASGSFCHSDRRCDVSVSSTSLSAGKKGGWPHHEGAVVVAAPSPVLPPSPALAKAKARSHRTKGNPSASTLWTEATAWTKARR